MQYAFWWILPAQTNITDTLLFSSHDPRTIPFKDEEWGISTKMHSVLIPQGPSIRLAKLLTWQICQVSSGMEVRATLVHLACSLNSAVFGKL